MDQNSRHCPFLNRNDQRCAAHFRVGSMDHAFEHCFDHYKACPTYLELLVERRVRRLEARHVTAEEPAHLTIRGQPHAA